MSRFELALNASLFAGCATMSMSCFIDGRREARFRIAQLKAMKRASFEPPATPQERNTIKAALQVQEEWLATWHVRPWPPAMPWADLPMDKKHSFLRQ